MAELTDSSIPQVVAYRRAHAIPPFVRSPPVHGARPAPSPEPAPPREPVARVAARAAPPKKGGRGRVEDLERIAHLVGTVSDAVVAEKAGVSRSLVAGWRKQRGIPAAHPHRDRSGATAADRAEHPRPSADPRPRPLAVEPARREEARPIGVSRAFAFTVVGVRKDQTTSFVVLGADLAAAARRALSALEARRDGPWAIEEIRLLGDAIAE